MTNPILIIDPGHGGKDPGGGSNEHWKEKDFVLQISLYQYERFKQLGVPVALTRDTDVYISPTDRARLVRESGADYCISNHINAAEYNTARGAETIYSIFSNSKLAKSIYEAIVSEGMPGRRVFQRHGSNGLDYYYMHRDTGVVETVIVEYGFATNAEDTELLGDNWKRFAEAGVKAFCEHIKYPYSSPKEDHKEAQIYDANFVINGKEIDPGVLINGRTYAPVRALLTELGISFRWDGNTKTVYIEKDPH